MARQRNIDYEEDYYDDYNDYDYETGILRRGYGL